MERRKCINLEEDALLSLSKFCCGGSLNLFSKKLTLV